MRNHYRGKVKAGLLSVSAIALAVAGVIGVGTMTAHAADSKKSDDKVGYLLISPATNSIQLHNSDVYTGKMSVQNTKSREMKIKMSVGSYVIQNDNYDSPNYDSENKYSLMRNWIKLDADEFTLKSGESRDVHYTVVAPANPPAGSQYATIFAEDQPTEQLKGSGIQATSRVGLVLTARMLDGKTIDRSNLYDVKIDGYQPTAPLKTGFGVKNEGNIGTSVVYSMTVKNALNGAEVYKSKDQTNSVYPETKRKFTLNWDKPGAWFYNVELKIKLNGNERTIKQLVCTVPIWIIILLIVAIVCLVAYAVLNYRARKEIRENRAASSRKSTKSSKSKSTKKNDK